MRVIDKAEEPADRARAPKPGPGRRGGAARPGPACDHAASLDHLLAELRQALPGRRGPDREAFRRLWDGATDCLAVLDAKGRIVWLNGTGLRLWRLSRRRAPLGASFLKLWDDASHDAVRTALQAARPDRGASFRAIIPAGGGSGSVWEACISTASGAAPGGEPLLLLVARDVTEHLRREASLDWAASFDAMTGVLNRATLIQRVTAGLGRSERLTLVLLDLDHLKRANDTDGHAAGNELIMHFAARLRATQGERMMAARLGGDEFALACLGEVDRGALEAAVAGLCRPAHVEPLTAPYSASAGIALDMPPGLSFDEVHLCADRALYACKAAGGARHRVFDATMREHLQKEACVVSITGRATARGDVVPHYQPKVDLRTGALLGFEALLRVRFPDGTVQTAAAVAAALRQPDLASRIDRAMIGAVLADLRSWAEDGIEVPVAINLSDGEVRARGFAERFLGMLSAAGVPPRLIEVEVAETVLLDRSDPSAERALRSLSAAGVRIALDDFGTGYASLSHLARFPIGTIKIDSRLVQALPAAADDRAIVRASIGIGQSLGLAVVAGGIESADQLDALRSEGCEQGQGVLFSPALRQDEVRVMARRVGEPVVTFRPQAPWRP